MQWAFLLAVFLVYAVMASQFEDLFAPLIILFSVPLAFVGVAATLYLGQIRLSVVVFIGVVMLAGIVVNNAIVMVDYIGRLRRRGLALDAAIREGATARLRPILMTTLTTILGLTPMALSWGEGAELRSPLAITVASGLAFSTLLTLVVIPAAYLAVPSRIDPE